LFLGSCRSGVIGIDLGDLVVVVAADAGIGEVFHHVFLILSDHFSSILLEKVDVLAWKIAAFLRFCSE
jgi:hypothetical protein